MTYEMIAGIDPLNNDDATACNHKIGFHANPQSQKSRAALAAIISVVPRQDRQIRHPSALPDVPSASSEHNSNGLRLGTATRGVITDPSPGRGRLKNIIITKNLTEC